MEIKYSSYSTTHVGKKRTNNEDAYGELTVAKGKLFIVCDGMGGHAAGERASAIAVQTIIDFFKSDELIDVSNSLTEAIRHANKTIWEEALNDSSLKGMGTTCVVVFIHNNGEIFIGHVGDSRCYLLSTTNELTSLTKDHSYVQFLIDTGDIKEEDAFDHPSKNRILKALGIDANVSPSVNEQPFKFSSGNTLLLCTDGLNDMLRDNEIRHILQGQDTLANQANELINAALDKGGKDNVTLTIIRIEESPFGETNSSFSKENDHKQKKRNKSFYVLLIVCLVVIGGLFYLFSPFNVSDSKLSPSQSESKDTMTKQVPTNEDSVTGSVVPTN
jgi:PPM family protein phosphatase